MDIPFEYALVSVVLYQQAFHHPHPSEHIHDIARSICLYYCYTCYKAKSMMDKLIFIISLVAVVGKGCFEEALK